MPDRGEKRQDGDRAENTGESERAGARSCFSPFFWSLDEIQLLFLRKNKQRKCEAEERGGDREVA